MSRLSAALFAALLLALCCSPRSSSGQTAPTGTPTPLPTAPTAPSPTPGHHPAPSGTKLLALSLAATERAGSYHTVERSVTWVAGHRHGVSLTMADTVTRPRREHTVETEEEFGPGHRHVVTHEESIDVGQFTATRHPGGAWDCVNENAPAPQGNGGVIKGGVTEIQRVISPAVHELAPTTVNGIPVWHLRLMATIRPPGGPVRWVYDYFISQVDYRLRRQVMVFGVRVGRHAEEAITRTDYSRYGYPYHIALPKACAVFHGVFGPMGPPPARLLRQGGRAVERSTVHIDTREVVTRPGKIRTVSVAQIDQRAHQHWVRLIEVDRRVRLSHPPRVISTRREEVISVGRRWAERQGNGPWRCPLAVVGIRIFERPGGRSRIAGQAYVDGTPAWRVHTRIPAKPGVSHTEDEYVSVRDHRLIREVERTVDRTTKPLTRTVVQTDYTRYGVPIHVVLPRCHG